ncbi:hypothetical protein [Rummeliibacillus pycnus]|uniref:hypothetical protein n=1 Tax=Rummeliibacillus pycnus TaxID=101070 RepID=UPI000C9D0F50|nr:hypothetical protein [Rummeliibacillus pycnus]
MLFKKRSKVEVVPESEWTDFSEVEQYATKKQLAVAMCVPTVASVGLLAHRLLADSTHHVMAASASAPIMPVSAPMPTHAVVTAANSIGDPTGVVANASLDLLATILDPIIDILVAISFPVASVIMVGACFFFMFGNSEKAWSMIMNAGLGYVLIQVSPLFLEILRKVGEAV